MKLPGGGPARRLKQVLRFSKPKTPGFGISRDFYLSVLCGKPQLPSLLELANPKGEGGAVVGQIAPLNAGSDKSLLLQPMTRGGYVLASLDHASVIRVLTMPRDEAGFDPAPFLQSDLAANFSPEVHHRVAATWHVVQLNFESHDPLVYPALDLVLGFASRLANLTDGVVADPVALTYRLPSEVFCNPRRNPNVDAREHVSVQATNTRVNTRGLTKFALHDLEINDVSPDLMEIAAGYVIAVAQSQLLGNLIEVGDYADKLLVSHSTDKTRFELIPPRDTDVNTFLRSLATSSKVQRENA